MKILVTGADGFVGQWLIRDLLAGGHHVIGAMRIGGAVPASIPERDRIRVDWIEFDLLAPESIDRLAERRPDAVIHLAAVASGVDARQDPGYAWTANAAGTARLCEAFGRLVLDGRGDPTVLIASTGEVYGQGKGVPFTESDPLVPCSPYAASKVGAEVASEEVARRTGLRVIIARAFPHTGPGQSDKYVIPAIAARIRTAKRIHAPVIKTGNLEPVRDFLDVRDVVSAYGALIERGKPGAAYNVSSGQGRSLEDVVDELIRLVETRVIVEQDPALGRVNDLRHLVGDSSRLRRDTGWASRIPFEQTLRDLVDAQTD